MRKYLIPLFSLTLLYSCDLHPNKTIESTASTAKVISGQIKQYLKDVVAEKATPAESEGYEIPAYESPRGGQIIHHTGFTLSYDADYKTPQWVGWSVTKERAQGTVPRSDNFLPDPKVRGAKAYQKDYTNSGYDRGHIAPAGDMKWSRKAMDESFYLSNICPQNKNLNRGDWKDLEELEREWAISHGIVSITAGPVYNSKKPKRIGANRVAVPDGFFKVILRGTGSERKAYAFLFKNEAGSRPLSLYQLSVDELETALGFDFFPALPDAEEEKLEKETPEL